MAHLEGACEQVNHRLNSMDGHILALRQAVDALSVNVDRRFTWMIGIFISTWLTTIAAILPLYFRH